MSIRSKQAFSTRPEPIRLPFAGRREKLEGNSTHKLQKYNMEENDGKQHVQIQVTGI